MVYPMARMLSLQASLLILCGALGLQLGLASALRWKEEEEEGKEYISDTPKKITMSRAGSDKHFRVWPFRQPPSS